MKIRNVHERTIAATPEQIAQLLADFEGIWPTQIAPAPRAQGERLYKASVMLWQEYDRPGAARAFRVLSPAELQGENWFELERALPAPSYATQSKARHSATTRQSGENVLNPPTTSSWKRFSTTSRRHLRQRRRARDRRSPRSGHRDLAGRLGPPTSHGGGDGRCSAPAGAGLGPVMSGLLSPVPVFLLVLAAFAHRTGEAGASIRSSAGSSAPSRSQSSSSSWAPR